MGRISKYTPEERLQAVLDYKSGKRKVPEICRDLGLHRSGKAVYYWVAMYETLGEDIFETKRKNNVYSKEMKHTVVNDYLAGKGSYKQIALAYGIPSPSIVGKWIVNQGGKKAGKKPKHKQDKELIKKLLKENQILKKKLTIEKNEYSLWKRVKDIESEYSQIGKYKPKYMAIKEFHDTHQWSINWMCEVLQTTRTSYYRWLHEGSNKEA